LIRIAFSWLNITGTVLKILEKMPTFLHKKNRVYMKIVVILLFIFITVTANSQILPAEEFYRITEAYLIRNDTTFSLKESYVDQPSGITFVNENDSTTVISVDHGSKESVVYIGNAAEIDDPGNFEFLQGEKRIYFWLYDEYGSEEPEEAIVLKEFNAERSENSDREYFFFRIIFMDRQILFYGFRTEPE